MVTIRGARVDDLQVDRVPAVLRSLGWDDAAARAAAAQLLLSDRPLVGLLHEELVAFGAVESFARGGTDSIDHVSMLYVRRDMQGRGIGAALLWALLGASRPSTVVSSLNGPAIACYARAGLVARWPVFGFEGVVPSTAGTLRVRNIAAADAAAYEEHWTGLNRMTAFKRWGAAPGGGVLAIGGTDPVAVAAVSHRERLVVNHLVASGTDVWPQVFATLASMARIDGRLALHVPGPSPVVALALGANLRITSTDLFMSTVSGLVNPAVLIPDPTYL